MDILEEARHHRLAREIPQKYKLLILADAARTRGNLWAWVSGPSWRQGWNW